MKLKPDIYKKSIYDINYKKLEKDNIKLLIFDFDNTLISHKNKDLDEKIKKFLIELGGRFNIIIISNTWNPKKIKRFSEETNINYVMKAMKPFSYGYRKAKKISHYKKEEICMIGDQIFTDIFGAKRLGYKTVLVDPLSNNEMFFTKINRLFEKKLLKKFQQKYKFKRGVYFE
jgi:HAD superfamily phosphatase (TIGR01668 family)